MSENRVPASIFDVAKYVTEKVGKPRLSQIKLYKLLWFCQGWHFHLAKGNPLFNETFEAWKYGPVPKDLWNFFWGRILLTTEDFNIVGDANKIPSESKEIIDVVLKYYGPHSPNQLRVLSLQCAPWECYFHQLNQSIPNDEIRKYFYQLK